MPEDHVYQVWAKNLTKPKKESTTPPDNSERNPSQSVPLRGCRRRFLPEAQVVPVPVPVKRQRGNHDS